jgi:hypothetical protein
VLALDPTADQQASAGRHQVSLKVTMCNTRDDVRHGSLTFGLLSKALAGHGVCRSVVAECCLLAPYGNSAERNAAAIANAIPNLTFRRRRRLGARPAAASRRVFRPRDAAVGRTGDYPMT